jgi:hypothetical protein
MKKLLPDLALLLVSADSPTTKTEDPSPKKPAVTFAGSWETSFGLMTLKPEGDLIKGHYLFGAAKATIEGKVVKNKLTFTYEEPTGVKGEGWFELADDGQSFAGEWRDGPDRPWRKWLGKRTDRKEPIPTFAGLWQSNFGKMRLLLKDKHVEGIYSFSSSSTLEGTVERNKLTFNYKEPKTEGEGWFELSEDGNAFSGKWREKGTEAWSEWNGRRIGAKPGVVWLVVIEANWERDLEEQEYAFGAMLRAFFARAERVKVRHRFFNDEPTLKKWCREVAFLAEPVVVSLATHGSPAGASVDGRNIDGAALADDLRYAGNVKLLHFSACEMMKDRLASDMVKALEKHAEFPISGYTTAVDWAGSAIIEFTYYDMILVRGMTPEAAAEQVKKLVAFAGDKDVPGAAIPAAGFKFLAPAKADKVEKTTP